MRSDESPKTQDMGMRSDVSCRQMLDGFHRFQNENGSFMEDSMYGMKEAAQLLP